jgi:hypothetical protein
VLDGELEMQEQYKRGPEWSNDQSMMQLDTATNEQTHEAIQHISTLPTTPEGDATQIHLLLK